MSVTGLNADVQLYPIQKFPIGIAPQLPARVIRNKGPSMYLSYFGVYWELGANSCCAGSIAAPIKSKAFVRSSRMPMPK